MSGTKFRLEVIAPVMKTKDFISEFNATVLFLYLHLSVVFTSICHSSFSPSSKNRATMNIKSHPFVCSFVCYLGVVVIWNATVHS